MRSRAAKPVGIKIKARSFARPHKKAGTAAESDELKGWSDVAAFLAQPVSAAQRWASSGMPVQKRGNRVYASKAELSKWLQSESAGQPVQISTDETDLSAELRRGLSYVKQHGNRNKNSA